MSSSYTCTLASLLPLLASNGDTQRFLCNPFRFIRSVCSDHLTALCALITHGSCIHFFPHGLFCMPLHLILSREDLFLDDEIQPSYSTRNFFSVRIHNFPSPPSHDNTFIYISAFQTVVRGRSPGGT